MTKALRTLLHLSDVHFGRDHALPQERPLSGRPTLLDALTKDLEGANLRPDRVIVSGDVVSTGSREEYGLFRGFLDLLCRSYDLRPEHVLIVPGNHDVLWGASPDSVSRGEYEVFLSNFHRLPAGDSEPARMIDEDIAIIGLDTTSLLRQSASGIGLIGPDQLKAAERLLVGPKHALRILVLHHHLLPVAWIEPAYPNGVPSLTLDAPSVLSWAQENEFAIILHGHQHQSYLTTFHFAAKRGGPLLIAGAPSAAASDLPPQGRNGYHILQIDEGNITVSVRELTEELRFVEARRVSFVREASGTFAVTAIPTIRGFREPSVDEVRALTRSAVQTIKRVMSESYGPKGGLRVVADMASVRHVRSGLRIADSIGVDDPVQNRIFLIARSLARGITGAVGDGRKTSVILWAALVAAGLEESQDPTGDVMTETLSAAVLRAIDHLRKMSKMAHREDIEAIATFAAGNNRSVGEAVVEAMKKAGKEGLIEVRRRTDSSVNQRNLELIVSIHAFDAFKLPNWFTEVAPTGEIKLSHPAFILCDGATDMQQLVSAFERLMETKRPVIVVAKSFNEESMAMMALNNRRKVLLSVPLRADGPRNEGVLHDLAVLTGARIFNPGYGDNVGSLMVEDAGTAASVEFTSNDVLVFPGPDFTRERISEAVSVIRDRIKASPSSYEQALLQARLARLVGAYVVMEAVGVSDEDSELWEAAIADAVHSARNAAEEGVVLGGGDAYAKIAEALLAEAHGSPDIGTKVLIHALREPARILKERASTETGVLDSAKGLRLALTLATDAAVRTLRTRTVEVSTHLSVGPFNDEDENLDHDDDD